MRQRFYNRFHVRSRSAFTLVELVIVVLIIGILASIAAPKFMDTSNDARLNATRQSLAVVRNAIELYRQQNSQFPGQTGGPAGLKSDLAPYLQGPFPKAEAGNQNDDVRVQATGTPLSASGSQGWAYDRVTGEFIINHSSYETL